MAKRKAISKSDRFEIFKRDGFKCQYCGAHPPESILHVDHITPIAKGGGNEADNLITACSICNAGKAARLLSSIPQSLKEKSEEVIERELQIKGYSEIMRLKRDRIENDAWEVTNIFLQHFRRDGIRKDYFQSIKRFIEALGDDECIEAMKIAVANKPYSENIAFRYFCGVCWKKIRDKENG